MIKELYRLFCSHDYGVTIITAHKYSAGCSFDEEYKYVICSRCGKILIDRDLLEEYTGAEEQESEVTNG